MKNAGARFSHRLQRAARALSRDARATAAVEAALILPVALTMFALLLYGAEAFAVQRKVTLTARTVTDLVTQAAPTSMNSGASVVVAASIDPLLNVSSSVLTPYSNVNLAMVVSEVLVDSNETTATVQWSEPCPNTTCLSTTGVGVRSKGTKVTLPTGLGTGQKGTYLILGEVSYNYTPLSLYTPATALTLNDAIYLTPRQSTSISCTDCASHS